MKHKWKIKRQFYKFRKHQIYSGKYYIGLEDEDGIKRYHKILMAKPMLIGKGIKIKPSGTCWHQLLPSGHYDIKNGCKKHFTVKDIAKIWNIDNGEELNE